MVMVMVMVMVMARFRFFALLSYKVRERVESYRHTDIDAWPFLQER